MKWFFSRFLVFVTLMVLAACYNPLQAPDLPEVQELPDAPDMQDIADLVAVSITIMDSARTVFPQVDLTNTSFKLFGSAAGTEEELAEFTSMQTWVYLSAGTWNFTLNAYDQDGRFILQGKIQERQISLTANNTLTFYLFPQDSGTGAVHISFVVPAGLGITRIAVDGELGSEELTQGDTGEFTYIKNSINAGDYFVSFRLFQGEERWMVYSELVLVRSNLTSAKTIDLTGYVPVTVPGGNLADKLNWLQSNAQSGYDYIVEANNDEVIAPYTLQYSGRNNISITLKGNIPERIISYNSSHSYSYMFNIGSDVTLILENITLQGHSNNYYSLVYVGSNGRLIMKTGAKITGNYARGVYVYSGTFTMQDNAEIYENGETGNTGGGVSVDYGTFTMQDSAAVYGNTASGGGGVYVNYGTFTMQDSAEVYGNISSNNGGGIYNSWGTFNMQDNALVYGNEAGSYGGGVYTVGTFRISGGIIYGNFADTMSNTAINGGASLYNSNTAQYGTFSDSGFTSNGSLSTMDFTLEVQDGQLVLTTPDIEMVYVPAGSFELCRNLGTGGGSDSTPVSTVTLSGFYIGKYPVTQEQYQAVMGSNPSSFSSNPAAGEVQVRRPVERVNWYDAIVFCNRLSIMEGLSPAYRINGSTNPNDWGTVPTNSNTTWDAVEIVSGSTGYRLPTEAQWEYAAKGGNGSPGSYTYSGSDDPDEVAWYSGNSNSMTHEVGLKQPNGLGLYDMSGNVWEWCWDWYDSYTGEDKEDPMGASSGSYRVVRGGDWYSSAEDVRSANRNSYNPNDRSNSLGFRLLRP